MSANQLKRTLWGQHKGSYKTAWYLCHRIRAAMKEVERPMLDGTVEMDETYVGGRGRGKGIEKRGRGTDKEIVIGIRQRGGDLRFFQVPARERGQALQVAQAGIRHIQAGEVEVHDVLQILQR